MDDTLIVAIDAVIDDRDRQKPGPGDGRRAPTGFGTTAALDLKDSASTLALVREHGLATRA